MTDLFELSKIDMKIDFVPTGIPGFDYHYKGIPIGKLVSVFGGEDVGKSTFGWYAMKAFQEYFHDKKVLLLDYEKKIDVKYLEIIGVDIERVLYSEFDTIEEGLQIARERLQDEDDISLIVLDSIAGASTKQEMEGDISDANMGVKARKIGQALRMITGLLNKNRTTLLAINQIRDNIGSYGGGITTPGGHAIKHHAILRIFLTRKQWKENDDGQIMNMHINKNHAGPKGKSVEVYIDSGRVWQGLPPIDRVRENVLLAIENGVLIRKGSYYYWDSGEDNLAQGQDNIVQYFKDKEEEYQKLLDLLYENDKVYYPDETYPREEGE